MQSRVGNINTTTTTTGLFNICTTRMEKNIRSEMPKEDAVVDRK